MILVASHWHGLASAEVSFKCWNVAECWRTALKVQFQTLLVQTLLVQALQAKILQVEILQVQIMLADNKTTTLKVVKCNL